MEFGRSPARREIHTSRVWGIAALMLVATAGCQGSRPSLTQLMDVRRIAADLRVEFSHAADATNQAVMADTDEMSAAAAREAEQAIEATQQSAAAVRRLLQDLGYSDELRLLGEFDRELAEYRALDKTILALAVENTNLKAQRLAFGPVQDAADAFFSSLEAIAGAVPSRDACCVGALLAKAVSAVREIQVLQARHIAESDEAIMTRIEGRMAAAETTARGAVADLTRQLPATPRSQLSVSIDALDRFTRQNTELLTLSRRNSNVRSLALSLGRKRTLTAACDDTLRALQDALSKRGFNATR